MYKRQAELCEMQPKFCQGNRPFELPSALTKCMRVYGQAPESAVRSVVYIDFQAYFATFG